MLARYLSRFRSLERNARLYLISNTIQAGSAGAIGVLYTLYLNALGYGTNFIGLVLFFGVIGAGMAIVPAAPLVNRLGWRSMLLWSDWVGGLAIVLQLLVPIPLVIFASTAVAGASFAIILIINTPLFTAYSPPQDRTAIFGLANALGLVAAVIGTVLGGVLPGFFKLPAVSHSGLLLALHPLLAANGQARVYQLAMLTVGATAVPSIIPIYRMSRDTPARGPTAVRARATRDPLLGSLGSPLLIGRRVRAVLARGWVLSSGVVGRFTVTQALTGFGAGLFVQYLNIYFVRHLHTTTAFFGAIAAVLIVAQAAASLLSAPYADRLGTVRGAVIAQLLSLPFLVLLGLGPALGIIAGAYLLRGALMALTGPPLQAFLMGAVAERERIVASEAFNVSWQIAGALGIVVGGQLIAAVGFQGTFYVSAFFYLASALLLGLWFGPRSSAKPSPRLDEHQQPRGEPAISGEHD